MHEPAPPRILIVEDERIVALDLQHSLQDLGFEVVGCAASPPEAMQLALQHRPDLVLMDINLGSARDGIDAATEIGLQMDTPVVFLTAYAEPEMLQRAGRTAPYGYLVKPVELRELNATVRMALARHQATLRQQQAEQRLRMALQAARMSVLTLSAKDGMVEIDGDLPVLARAGAVQGLRMPLAEFLGRLADAARAEVQHLIATHEDLHLVAQWQGDSGAPAWLEVHATYLAHEDAVVGVCRDVSEQIEQNAMLRQAAVVFESAADAIVILDDRDGVLTANPAFTRLTGWTVGEIRGRHPNDFLHGSRTVDRALLDSRLPEETGHAEVVCRKRGGETFPAWEHVAPVRDAQGRVVQRVLTFSDISALRQAESRVRHLAYHDTLTGLGNRHHMEELLARVTASQVPLAMLFMDLDGFKTINDTLGHATGDLLLMVVADRIRHCLRSGDEAIRLGGDEFVVIAQRGPVDDIGRLTSRVLDAVRQPVRLKALHEIRISSSIGVALYPEDGRTPEALLRAADVAMYAAKGGGRNRSARYSPQMSVAANTRLQMEQGLAQAIALGELSLHWQPQVDLASGRPVGNEVLLRWQSHTLGAVPPDRFIPLAEEMGLICELGRWVIVQALQEWVDRRARGLHPGRLAINVSALQLMDRSLAGFLRDTLDQWQVPADQVEIEITETSLSRVDGIDSHLRELHAIGVSVALDDFGTGQSALAMLKRLPLHRLKIDRSFVHELARSPGDQAILRAIVGLAQAMGLALITEGVETEAQRALLLQLGVDQAQGWLFARAMPPEDWARWWAEHRTAPPAAPPG